MTTFENLTTTQKMRATLHRDVRAMCTECCHLLGLDITKPAMEIVAELVYKKLSVYGTDLEAFAKHAKRTTVNSEDVKLLVRRNPSLKSHLKKLAPSTPANKEKKRKTMPAKSSVTPAPKTKENIEKTITTVEKPKVSLDKPIDNSLGDFVESMVIDDTIDLTFD